MRHDELEMIAVGCRAELREMGVELVVSQRFDDVGEVFRILDTQNRKGLGKAGDPDHLLLTQGNAFWLIAMRGETPILGFAVRVDDLRGESADSFLARSIRVIFGASVKRAAFDLFAGRQWGRAAYFGDLKANTAQGLGPEGAKIIRLAFAYAHFRAFRDFDADVNYCFMRDSDRSKAFYYGFLEADPFDWETDENLYPDGNPEWIMQIPKERLPSLMAHVAKALPKWQGIAVDKKQRFGIVNNTAGGAK